MIIRNIILKHKDLNSKVDLGSVCGKGNSIITIVCCLFLILEYITMILINTIQDIVDSTVAVNSAKGSVNPSLVTSGPLDR